MTDLPRHTLVLFLTVDSDRPSASQGDALPLPSNPPSYALERERLVSVREVEPFTWTNDPAMMSVARKAAEICGVKVGMVSVMEEEEEWVVACVGTEIERVPRALSFCAHTILEADALVVEDASRDVRFLDNPFVRDEHHLRFYAGAPIFGSTGLPLGAVCVADAEPNSLSSKGLLALRDLAATASAVLEIRLLLADARTRYAPETEHRTTRARLDALLLTLLEPRLSRL